jgi:hypothetical protein
MLMRWYGIGTKKFNAIKVEGVNLKRKLPISLVGAENPADASPGTEA